MRRRKARKGKRRVIVLDVADMHAGNRLGLMNPDVVLFRQDEFGELIEWKPPLGPLQSRLWPWFVEDVGKVAALAGDSEIIYLHQGDVVQGRKHAALQVGHRSANQLLIAVANQDPILSLPNIKKARFVAGTSAHDGLGASEVLAVVEVLRAKYADVQFKALYHGVLDIDGFKLDYAHHGPHPGSRTWLAGNAALWYLRSQVDEELERSGDCATRLWTRAHQHTYRRSTLHKTLLGTERQFDIVLLPSWCGMGDYARKVTRSAMSQSFGMVAFEVVGGELVGIHPFVHELDLRTEEML